ncbi:MAG: solute carrier family 23 protein, partial [Oscillospiraceae bacterium]
MGSIKNTLKEQGTLKTIIIGIQHVLAMFGATVLVPILTGLNPSIALLSAGIGTLVFHLVTKRKVPVFLGSSFAFIAGLQTVINKDVNNIPKAMGGVIVAGCIYLLLALLVKIFGAEKVRSFFPPVVTGPIIIVIGLSLAPGVVTGNIIDNATGELWQRLLIALIVVLTMLLVGVFAKGFFKLVPILFGIVAGYIASACFGFVNFQPVAQANWFLDFSQFRLPEFDISAILVIAPIAIVTFVEHIGDITTNSAVVGKDFLTDPGLHRTLMGDGLATI